MHRFARRIALLAGLLPSAVPAQAQVTGGDPGGYALNVATGSLEGPFTPSGVTDLQRLRLFASPTVSIVRTELAWETALSLYSDAALGGLFFILPGGGVRREPWLPLQGTLAEGEHARWVHRVDRLSLSVPIGEHVELSAGREAVSWATTLFLTPADPFAPFDPADPFRDFRVGVDVARARVYLGAFTELDAVVNPSEVDGETRITALLRGSTLAGSWELGGWGGLVFDRPGAAAFATLTVSGVALRAEASVRDEPDGTVWRASAGADRNLALAGRDLYLALEYQYDGFGAGSAEELPATILSDAFARGELQVLGRQETAIQASWQIAPLVGLEGLALWSLSDGSLLLSPAAALSLSNEITGRVGIYIGFGRESRDAALIPGEPDTRLPGSEYGVVPASLYASLTAYF